MSLGSEEQSLHFIDTPGHARHHYSLHLPAEGVLFAGDTLEVSHPEPTKDGECIVYPSTSPAAFDPEALLNSLDRLMDLDCSGVYLTHFGWVEDYRLYRADLATGLGVLKEDVELNAAEILAWLERSEQGNLNLLDSRGLFCVEREPAFPLKMSQSLEHGAIEFLDITAGSPDVGVGSAHDSAKEIASPPGG